MGGLLDGDKIVVSSKAHKIDLTEATACENVAVAKQGNIASGNGEGFVHIHRGFFGKGDLSQSGYDWRNPMMRVEMEF